MTSYDLKIRAARDRALLMGMPGVDSRRRAKSSKLLAYVRSGELMDESPNLKDF